MKNILTIYILCGLLFCTQVVFGQTNKDTGAKDTKWLEKKLNTMVKQNEADKSNKQFAFDNCQCKFATNTSKGGGFNFDMSYSFHLNEVSSVSYARNEDDTYELVLKLNKDKKSEGPDFSSFTTTLYNTDEKGVKEVINTFKTATQACKTSK